MKALLSIFLALVSFIGIHAQDVQNVADSNNLFAFKLYAEVNKGNSGNLFFSPFSISTALAMTYAGARGETEAQMCQTLHFNLDQTIFHKEYKNYLEKIEADTGKGLIMGIANSIWVANTCKILAPFSEIVNDDYNSESKNVDFARHTEHVRQEINTWVEDKTNDKIKELIKPGIIDGLTRVVLVNAIYFNGKWETSFSKDSTKKDSFYKDSATEITADFMNKTAKYKYYQDINLQAVEIPYSGEKTSMVVFLPKAMNGINDMENKLDNTYYSKIVSSMYSRKLKLELPKFKTTVEFELSGALSDMGMPIAFANADFSGMSNEPLSISAVVHKAFVDVSEKGTEAAAATAVVMKMMAMRPLPNVVFIVNHPFIFVIKDNITDSILFMGKINDPTKE